MEDSSETENPQRCNKGHRPIVMDLIGRYSPERHHYRCPICGREVVFTSSRLVGGPRPLVIRDGQQSASIDEDIDPNAEDGDTDTGDSTNQE